MMRPTHFYDDATMDVEHSDLFCGATARIPISDTVLEPDHMHLRLVCPAGCGSEVRWGVSGSGAPEMVQRLYVRRLAQELHSTFLEAREAHRQMLESIDGLDRWKLADVLDRDEEYVPVAPVMEAMAEGPEVA